MKTIDFIENDAIILSQAEAKRLADLYLANAEVYREPAGLPHIRQASSKKLITCGVKLPAENAKRLSDLYLALAQEYTKIGGDEPIQTRNVERNPGRLKPLAVDGRGMARR